MTEAKASCAISQRLRLCHWPLLLSHSEFEIAAADLRSIGADRQAAAAWSEFDEVLIRARTSRRCTRRLPACSQFGRRNRSADAASAVRGRSAAAMRRDHQLVESPPRCTAVAGSRRAP
jgi:hypothetical protein